MLGKAVIHWTSNLVVDSGLIGTIQFLRHLENGTTKGTFDGITTINGGKPF